MTGFHFFFFRERHVHLTMCIEIVSNYNGYSCMVHSVIDNYNNDLSIKEKLFMHHGNTKAKMYRELYLHVLWLVF